MKALLAFKAWLRSVGRMEDRALLISNANASVGRRSLMWNAYSDALIPYPARVVMPDSATIKRMLVAQRTAIQSGTPWCPLSALSALGVVYGVKGSPKCPKISAWTHGTWAHIRGEPWGPAHAREAQSLLWEEAVRHAHHIALELRGNPSDNNSAHRAARIIIRTASERFSDPQAGTAPGLGHCIHIITWHRVHAARFVGWTTERSNKRRWALGDGNEWHTLKSAQNITDAARLRPCPTPALQCSPWACTLETQLTKS